MKSYFEEIGGTYTRVDHFLIPNLMPEGQMEWVRRMNSIRSRAEEFVQHDLIYACSGIYASCGQASNPIAAALYHCILHP